MEREIYEEIFLIGNAEQKRRTMIINLRDKICVYMLFMVQRSACSYGSVSV